MRGFTPAVPPFPAHHSAHSPLARREWEWEGPGRELLWELGREREAEEEEGQVDDAEVTAFERTSNCLVKEREASG